MAQREASYAPSEEAPGKMLLHALPHVHGDEARGNLPLRKMTLHAHSHVPRDKVPLCPPTCLLTFLHSLNVPIRRCSVIHSNMPKEKALLYLPLDCCEKVPSCLSCHHGKASCLVVTSRKRPWHTFYFLVGKKFLKKTPYNDALSEMSYEGALSPKFLITLCVK